ADGNSGGDPWSVALYAGPSTTKYIGSVIVSGNYHPTSAMAGLALTRRLIYLGADIWIGSEAQATEYWFGHHDTSYAVGLGFLFNDPFGFKHTSFAVYDGPSWDTDPPHLAIGYDEKVYGEERKRYLNYISFEFAARLPHSEQWDGILRIYHRSGMFGVFSIGDDESTA